MKLVLHKDLGREDWIALYAAIYSPELGQHMGNDWASRGEAPPTFGEFFIEIQEKISDGNVHLWAILNGKENIIGFISLTRTPEVDEWEVGVAIADPKYRGTGYAVRVHTHVLGYAFHELNATWVWAVSLTESESLYSILERIGYQRFAHFYVLHRDWFVDSKWDRRK